MLYFRTFIKFAQLVHAFLHVYSVYFILNVMVHRYSKAIKIFTLTCIYSIYFDIQHKCSLLHIFFVFYVYRSCNSNPI
uniref:Putative secreted protein n=1 Tax=Xenopsylla cheopis TaxID=163159 RepID=A0A6M2E0Z9_XENCH